MMLRPVTLHYVLNDRLLAVLPIIQHVVLRSLNNSYFCYPPKLSYMMLSGSTPSESSMETTAADMGPGPHM